jgi:hypothetical protein
MSGDLDPQVSDLLKEFLEEKRSEKAKGYTLENLANAFLLHKDEDAKWKREAQQNVKVQFASLEARQNRHARRLGDLEKQKAIPLHRNPDDTGHEFVVEAPDDRGWLGRVLREKAVAIALTLVMLLLSAGAVAVIQAAAHAPRVPQLETHP